MRFHLVTLEGLIKVLLLLKYVEIIEKEIKKHFKDREK